MYEAPNALKIIAEPAGRTGEGKAVEVYPLTGKSVAEDVPEAQVVPKLGTMAEQEAALSAENLLAMLKSGPPQSLSPKTQKAVPMRA